MAVGGSDWVDTGAWVQTARRSAAARPDRDTSASDRTDAQSRARFGEALSAARSRDQAVSRARSAREASSDTRTAIAVRESGAAERSADDKPPASPRDDDTNAARDAVRSERAAGTTRSASGETQDNSGAADTSETATAAADTTKAGDTAKTGDAKKSGDTTKADATKGGQPATDPNVPATGQAAAAPTPQPTLIALFAALAGGSVVAAAPDGAATDAAGGGRVQGATGAAAASPTGAAVATVAGSATPATAGGAGVPQAGAEPTPPDGGAAAAAVDAKPQAESTEGAAKPDFLSALADAGQDAAPIAGGPNPVVAPAASAAHGATYATSSTATAAPAASTAAAPPPVQIGQVPMTIGLRSLQGSSEFQIRLDPAELGSIEVKLEIDKARGTVMTHLVVDRPDTLAMLQRDAGQLQQALSQAGLDASGGVGVSLRGDGGAQNGPGSDGRDRPRGDNAWTAETSEPVQGAAPMRALRGYGGLDIRI